MAGESAEQVARRQREHAERLMRSADLWERGAVGERTTGAILDPMRAEGWAVFHDVRWPGRVRANLDHVVVGPAGVFVIDSKNWAGRIEVRDNTFRCNGRRQDRAVAAAGDAALAVAGLVSAPAAGTTRSVVCFVRDEPLGGWCHEVMICSTGNLRQALTTLPAVLSPEEVRVAALELDILFRNAAATPQHRPQYVFTQPSAPRPVPAALVPSPPRAKERGITGRLAVLVAFLVALLVVASLVLGQLHRLAAPEAVPTYDSCRALRADHPRGVGTTSAVSMLHRTAHRPAADDAAYAANAALDRDRDGIACERR